MFLERLRISHLISLRKYLVETLVLSQLDFSNVVFYPVTETLLERLQRIQFSAASFVTVRYVNINSAILKLGWLLMRERSEWHHLQAAHKSLYSDRWPQYLRLETVSHKRLLCSSGSISLVRPLESNTFQDNASALFNALPPIGRSCHDFKYFCSFTRTILKERCDV